MKEENQIIIKCLNKYGKVPETYKLLEKIDLLEEENQSLKNIIYTTLEYVDREEVSSVGTPFTSTSIGKEIKELLEGEKTFNSIWKKNQKLNNVLNEIDKILIEHIDECKEELNTIYKTKDSEYINQCSKEFDVIRKNIEMIINKVNKLKESDK
jgi:hypothetical protein